MIIRVVKQLSNEVAREVKEADAKTLELSTKIRAYCNIIYEALSKKIESYSLNAPLWYQHIVRENIGPFEQPEYQLKNLATNDFSFKSKLHPACIQENPERNLILDNLYVELNFLNIDNDLGRDTDISFTIMNEKNMNDTFAEHYCEVIFELCENVCHEPIFELANYFYNKPVLYKKTYEALEKREKYLANYAGGPITDSYMSLFSIDMESIEKVKFDVQKEIIDKEILFFRNSIDDSAAGFKHLASFETYGETNVEAVQLQLTDNNILAIDIMLKNSYIESASSSISSKNYKETLNNPMWDSIIDKEINNWLGDIIFRANFMAALYKQIKNTILVENL